MATDIKNHVHILKKMQNWKRSQNQKVIEKVNERKNLHRMNDNMFDANCTILIQKKNANFIAPNYQIYFKKYK